MSGFSFNNFSYKLIREGDLHGRLMASVSSDWYTSFALIFISSFDGLKGNPAPCTHPPGQVITSIRSYFLPETKEDFNFSRPVRPSTTATLNAASPTVTVI